jgi:hypothetical protein
MQAVFVFVVGILVLALAALISTHLPGKYNQRE